MGGQAHKGRAIVLGELFQRGDAVAAFTTLHYALSLRRLGYEVFYLEPAAEGAPAEHEAASISLLESHGFGAHWSRYNPGSDGTCTGLARGQLESLCCDADFLLSLAAEPLCEPLAVPRRIYVRPAPFQPGPRSDQAIHFLADYDTLFQVGTNPSEEHGRVWLPTLPPVLLDLWPALPQTPAGAYVTLAAPDPAGRRWSDTWGWTEDRDLEKLLLLPTLRNSPFEMIADLEDENASRFTAQRWRVTAPNASRHDVHAYRALFQNARALYLGAPQQSVASMAGWLSGAAAWCLASGRPVIAQETGFSQVLPTGKGLFAFGKAREALAALDAIENDYARQSRAARDLAAEHFEGERVLSKLLRQAGIEA